MRLSLTSPADALIMNSMLSSIMSVKLNESVLGSSKKESNFHLASRTRRNGNPLAVSIFFAQLWTVEQ